MTDKRNVTPAAMNEFLRARGIDAVVSIVHRPGEVDILALSVDGLTATCPLEHETEPDYWYVLGHLASRIHYYDEEDEDDETKGRDDR